MSVDKELDIIDRGAKALAKLSLAVIPYIRQHLLAPPGMKVRLQSGRWSQRYRKQVEEFEAAVRNDPQVKDGGYVFILVSGGVLADGVQVEVKTHVPDGSNAVRYFSNTYYVASADRTLLTPGVVSIMFDEQREKEAMEYCQQILDVDVEDVAAIGEAIKAYKEKIDKLRRTVPHAYSDWFVRRHYY